MEFQSHFSDASAHNADTTFEHMKNSSTGCMRIFFFVKGGKLYDTTDGCGKQYICANVLWLLSVLAFIYRVIIDI